MFVEYQISWISGIRWYMYRQQSAPNTTIPYAPAAVW